MESEEKEEREEREEHESFFHLFGGRERNRFAGGPLDGSAMAGTGI